MHDALGVRMKEQYEQRTKYKLPRRTYTIIRLDGKAFHTFTKGCERPFDQDLMSAMDATARYLCANIEGAKFGYVQSDEISILLTDFTRLGTNAWFDGNIQKITSISAAMAAAYFNDIYDSESGLAFFDSRVFTIPDPVEVENYFIWRQNDATRNSIQMAAQALYSHGELHGKGQAELQDMMHEKGVNWNEYIPREKRGGLILKENYKYNGADRSHWIISKCPVFTQEREALRNLIPRIEYD